MVTHMSDEKHPCPVCGSLKNTVTTTRTVSQLTKGPVIVGVVRKQYRKCASCKANFCTGRSVFFPDKTQNQSNTIGSTNKTPMKLK